MMIDISGGALRILDDFIYYASTYPGRLADAMWWCEESFIEYICGLKETYDEAMASEPYQRCPHCGDLYGWLASRPMPCECPYLTKSLI